MRLTKPNGITRRRSIFLGVLASVMMILMSCNNEPTQSTALIPDDAALVMRLQLQQALADDDGSLMAESIKRLLRQCGMSRPLRRQVEKLIDNPQRTGIDMQQPLYFFTSLSGERAMVGTVSSRSKLLSVVNSIARDEHLDHQVTTTDEDLSMLDADSIVCLFTDDWFYIGRTDDANATADDVSRRAGGASSCNVELLNGSDDAVVLLLVTGMGLQEAVDLGTIGDAMPVDVDLAEASLLFSLTTQKGEATLTARLCPDSDPWRQFISDTDDMMLPVDRQQARYLSDRGLALLAHTDVQALHDVAEALAHATHADDEGTLQTIDNIFQSFKGSLQADIYALEQPGCRMNLYISSRDTTMARLVRELVLSDDSTLTLAPHQYVFPLDTIAARKATFGFSEGYTYLVTDSTPAFTTAASRMSADGIQGHGVYARMNGSMLSTMSTDSLGNVGRETVRLLGTTCRYVEAFYQQGGTIVVRFHTNEANHSALAVWLSNVEI